jgi:plastocyanin
MKLIARLAGVVVLLVLALGGSARAASTAAVTIRSLAFNPADVNIMTGDTVVWTNDDGVAHNVSGGSFLSGNFNSSPSTFQHTFTQPGTYSYFCSLHSGMTGSVNVTSAPDPVVPEASMAVLLPLVGLAIALALIARNRRAALG